MHIIIWIIQGIVASIFLLAGLMKAMQPAKKIRENLPWANDVSDSKLKFIGIIEILGAIGLIVPQLTLILPQLVWIAGFGLAIVMLLAMRLHAKRGEKKEINVNLVIFLFLLFVSSQRL